MRFSVVITTYNRRSLLERAIRSALNQSLAAEVIVVDDESSDDTADCVTQLQAQFPAVGDRRLLYQRNAANLGHSQSVNLGVGRAQGEWIKFLDDDDYLAPHCLQVMSEAIAQHPNVVLCSCQAIQVDAQEYELERTHSSGPGQAFYIPQADIHYGMLLEVVPFGTPVQVAAKRSAFLASGGWDSQFDGNCDDIDSWIRIAQFGDAVFLNRCLAYRTVWAGSHNQKFAIARRLHTNILMKRKIYPLVHQKYRRYLPKFIEVDRYLRLHWGLVAMSSGYLWMGLTTMLPACASLTAWSLLLRAFLFRQSPWLANKTRVMTTVLEASDRGAELSAEPTPQFTPQSTPKSNSASLSSLLIYDGHQRWLHDSQPFYELPDEPWQWGDAFRARSKRARSHWRRSRGSSPAAHLDAHPDPHPDMKLRRLRNQIHLRNLGRALLSGQWHLVLRLSRLLGVEYGQRVLARFYPSTPPVTKIPIASSSQHHANVALDILQRICRHESDLALRAQFRVLRRYLRLRWAIVALKQGYWFTGIWVGARALCSLGAWRFWIRLVRLRQLQTQKHTIRRMFLKLHRPVSLSEATPETPILETGLPDMPNGLDLNRRSRSTESDEGDQST